MNTERSRRRKFTSRNSRPNGDTQIVPKCAWRILQSAFAIGIVVWIGTAFRFLAGSSNKGKGSENTNNNSLRADSSSSSTVTTALHDKALDLEHAHIMALDIQTALPNKPTITVRISTFPDKCPKAYEFLVWMMENQNVECHPCTIYRGEPVPSYWGSKDHPDRWDNGGRWGPPYALVQGGLLNTKIDHIEREPHKPQMERGMVAWAGSRGVHFFIALAQHPEWGHEHTVWGRVLEEDMGMVDDLVKDHELVVLEKNTPVVTNFVQPMTFRMREIGA